MPNNLSPDQSAILFSLLLMTILTVYSFFNRNDDDDF